MILAAVLDRSIKPGPSLPCWVSLASAEPGEKGSTWRRCTHPRVNGAGRLHGFRDEGPEDGSDQKSDEPSQVDMAEAVSSESSSFMRPAGGINCKTHHAAHQFGLHMRAWSAKLIPAAEFTSTDVSADNARYRSPLDLDRA